MPSAESPIPTEMILGAKRPEDIFGDLGKTKEERLDNGKTVYRRLATAVHPDSSEHKDAEEAFKRLTKMWAAAELSIRAETYGTDRAKFAEAIRVRTKRHTYSISELLATGDIANIYRCIYPTDEGVEQEGILKVARKPADNDMIINEAKALKKVLTNKDTYDLIEAYLPKYIESFGYKLKGKNKPRQANVFSRPDYDLYTLEQVRQRYSKGVHAKDMAWMFRRLLASLGYIHSNGVIHGAILPPHLLIQPDMHGLVYVGWGHASIDGEQIKSVSSKYKDWYPTEVLKKEEPMVGTDIFMGVRCMVYVLGGDPISGDLPTSVPRPMRAFLKGCTQPQVKRRPQDAHALQNEFNELIENLYGPRKFREFSMA